MVAANTGSGLPADGTARGDDTRPDGGAWGAAWRTEFGTAHPELAAAASGATVGRLRLILGSARTGTQWAMSVLGQRSGATRVVREPLEAITPALGGQRPTVSMVRDHPLASAYAALAADDPAWRAFVDPRHVERDDPSPEIVIVKAIRWLTASEGLLGALGCPALLLVRDPIYVLDSAIHLNRLNAFPPAKRLPAFMEPAFSARYLPDTANELRAAFRETMGLPDGAVPRTLQLLLRVALFQRVLATCGQKLPNAEVIRYEDLCADPKGLFSAVARAWGIDWDESMQGFLDESTRDRGEPYRPHAVHRDSSAQPSRPFRVLGDEEAARLRDILVDLDLDESTHVTTVRSAASG